MRLMHWLGLGLLGSGCLTGRQVTATTGTSTSSAACDKPTPGWYLDVDGDGFGDGKQPSCEDAPLAVANDGDCDDSNSDVYPGRTEICTIGVARDDDCDATTRDPVASVGDVPYADLSSAALGAAGATVVLCDDQALTVYPIPVGDSLSVRSSSGEPGAVILTAAGAPIFELQGEASSLMLEGLTLAGGRGTFGGAITGARKGTGKEVELFGEVVLRKVLATGNEATYGGVVAADQVTFEGSSAAANVAALSGGAIYGNTIAMSGSHLTGNDARQGGAVHVLGTAMLTESTFYMNTAGLAGGAVYAGNPGDHSDRSLDLSYSVFTENVAQASGGAVFASRIDTVDATAALFRQNEASDSSGTASSAGGAVYLLTSIGGKGSHLLGGSFSDNTARLGGALFVGCDDGGLRLDGMVAERNVAEVGGALYISEGCSTTLERPWLSVNTAIQVAGGLFVANTSTLRIEHGMIIDNTAVLGGALYLGYDTDTTLQDTTLHRNNATNASSGAVHVLNAPGSFALHGEQLSFGLGDEDNEPYDVVMGPENLQSTTNVWDFQAGEVTILTCNYLGCDGTQ